MYNGKVVEIRTAHQKPREEMRNAVAILGIKNTPLAPDPEGKKMIETHESTVMLPKMCYLTWILTVRN